MLVGYQSSNESVAVVADGKVRIVGPGVSLITASQPGDENHNAAENVSQTLVVNPLIVTVSVVVSPVESGNCFPAGLVAEALKPLSIAAEPSRGYSFESWTVDANGSVANALSASTTLTPTGDCVATANFKVNPKGRFR